MEGCREEGKAPPCNDILLRIFVLTVVRAELLSESQGYPGDIQTTPSDENTAVHTYCMCSHTPSPDLTHFVCYSQKVWAGPAVSSKTRQPLGLWCSSVSGPGA
ncbi:hypothetical protein ATANTOWER_028707 [Ataeniobius toweri]|uniref:Uncharacterized protein n=1 Tax=Ataeniobius toweri TaxID=208326 RepID=A0ABU7AD11_9TELE|nr:hypothetical protein [Ataeniobius toweri]